MTLEATSDERSTLHVPALIGRTFLLSFASLILAQMTIFSASAQSVAQDLSPIDTNPAAISDAFTDAAADFIGAGVSETDGAPIAKDQNVRLSAAPLITGVAPGISILPISTSAALTVQQPDNDTSPTAPSLKADALARTRQGETSAAATDTPQSDIAQNANDAPVVSSESAITAPAPQQTSLTSEPEAQNTGATEGIQTDAPADFIPPYTENLDAVSNEPLFSPPQSVAWIIAIVVLGLFAALFSFFVRRLITNALDVEDASSEDLFQTSNDQVYRFDEDEDDYNDNTIDGRERVHQPLNANRYDNAMEEEDTLFGDDRDDEHDDAQPKRGFMSWLFSGGKSRDENASEDHEYFADDDHVIDVEAEPLDGDPHTEDDYAQVEIHRDAAQALDGDSDDHDESVSSSDEDDDRVEEPETMSVNSEPAPTPRPMPLRPAATTPLNAPFTAPESAPESVRAAYAFGPQDSDHAVASTSQMPTQPASSALSAHAQETLSRLEMRQRETAEAIADLRQKYTAQSQKVTTELGNFRAQSNAHQQSINKSLETRFAAISSSLEQGLVQTRKITDEKLANFPKQAPEMNTENLEKKLQNLDERFTSQARMTDMNFGKLMQKLDQVATPQPQLSKLSMETAEVKSMLAGLQNAVKPATQPVSELSRDAELLRNMQTSLDENQRMLSQFHAESRLTARNVEQLGERLGNLETDLADQRMMVNALVDQVQSAERAPPQERSARMDPLGILATPQNNQPIPAAPTASANEAPVTPETPAPVERSVITVSLDEPADAPVRPAPTPVPSLAPTLATTQNAPSAVYSNGHDPHPAPPQPEEQPDITPILIEPDSGAERASASRSDGPLSFGAAAASPVPQQSPAPVTPNPVAPKPLKLPEHETTQTQEKTIRPLTFGFSNFDKGSTNR